MNVVLAEQMGDILRSKGLTIALAESCTGGKLGDMITEVAGSSDYFMGGVISYSNRAKIELLGVKKSVLETKGAVSKEVALQMAEGARVRLHADIGVGITGIAGPSGGSKMKPVGLVYIAVSSEKRAVCTKNQFDGSRHDVKTRSATQALEMISHFLQKRT